MLTANSSAVLQFQPKPKQPPGRYIRIWYSALERLESLHAIERAIYQDMVSLLNGRNNGTLEYSARFCAKRMHINKDRSNRGLIALESVDLIRCKMRGSPQSAEGTKWEIVGYDINGREQNETSPVSGERQGCLPGETGLYLGRDKRLNQELDSIIDSSCPFNETDKARSRPKKEVQKEKQESASKPSPASSTFPSPTPDEWVAAAAAMDVVARAAAAMPRIGRAFNGAGKVVRGVPPPGMRRRGALAEDYEAWIAANGRTPRRREDDGSIIVPDLEWLEVLKWVAAGRPQLYEPLAMAPALGHPGDSLADFVP
jgi:hypothetical protein